MIRSRCPFIAVAMILLVSILLSVVAGRRERRRGTSGAGP